MTSKEDWITERAEEIALKDIGLKFDDLPPHLYMQVFMRAEEDYASDLIVQIDAARE